MNQKNIRIALLCAPLWTGWTAMNARAAESPATGEIRSVNVEEQAEGRARVVIATSIRPTFTTWKLDAPPRVVVEITGVAPGAVSLIDAATFAVSSVRASGTRDDSGPRTRVVLALRRAADFQVSASGNSIVVDVTPWEAPPPPIGALAAAAGPSSEKVVDAQRLAAAADAGRKAAEARALRAEEEAKRLTTATQRLVVEKAALQRSQADAEAAHAAAETLAKTLARKQEGLRAELERDAKKTGNASDRAAATRVALADLERRRAAAEKAEQALAAAMQRLALEKQEVEKRRQEADAARLSAAQSGEALRRDRGLAEAARAEAERLRTAAGEVEVAARQSLARAQAAEQRAASESAAASKAGAEKARLALDQARRETEETRRVAEKAAAEMQRLEGERKQLEEMRAALARREAGLSNAEKEARTVEAQVHQAQEKARTAEAAMAKVGAQRMQLAAERAELENQRAAARQAEQVIANDRESLNKRSVEQEAQNQRLRDQLRAKEVALATAAALIEKREREPRSTARPSESPELAQLRKELQAMKDAHAALKAARAGGAEDVERPARIEVAGGSAEPAAGASDSGLESRPRSVTLRAPSRVSRIDFVDEPGRSSVIIDLDEPADYSVERPGGRHITLRLHHADLPRVLERSLDARQFFGPVRLINSYREPGRRGMVLVDVELAEMVPNRIRQDGTRLYWDFQKPKPGSAASFPVHRDEMVSATSIRVAGFGTAALPMLYAQAGDRGSLRKKRYTGRRIDLDFKGADIHNILRLLADVGGVNIVTSDDVRGEVTIKMRDVPWDQALEVVLRAKTLGQVREGNLIRVAPMQVLEKELEQEIARQKQQVEVAPTETRLIGVSYAEAGSLETRAKDLLSPRGKVSVDERTNNLIVSDVAQNLGLVEELVRNLDTQTSQVVIEARIVEARSTFSRQFGIQWGGTGFMDGEHGNPTGLVFPNHVGVGGGADDLTAPMAGLVAAPRNGLPSSQSPNFAVNMPAPAGNGVGGALGLTLGSIAGAFNLNLRLSAMEQTGQVRILSSPRISTMDNVEATVEQGVAIPISVVSAAGVQTVFVDAKLNLTVKPHVTNEGTVVMDIAVTRNEPDFANTGARGDPTILKKQAKTKMLVRDGDTAVIGGIYQRNSGLSYSKVPFFADIPVLGILFRNRKENDDRTEFLVFITPRIVNRSRALAQ